LVQTLGRAELSSYGFFYVTGFFNNHSRTDRLSFLLAVYARAARAAKQQAFYTVSLSKLDVARFAEILVCKLEKIIIIDWQKSLIPYN